MHTNEHFLAHLREGNVNLITDFAEEYLRVEADPLAGVGQYTGIEQLDTSIRGAKRQELWLHAAFTGGMKSTFTINWAYNQAVYYNFSSLIYSLEMPYVQVRRILYAIHSGHEKFDGVRPTKEEDHINVDKLKYGELSQKAKEFLLNHVVPDFNDPNNHYGNILIEVANPDKGETTVGLANGILLADGKKIYSAENLKVGLFK